MNNNEISTNSGQSLNDSNDTLSVIRSIMRTSINKYNNEKGEYFKFFQQYPILEKRSDTISSTYDAVRRKGKSLAEIDKYFGCGASEVWLKIMIIEQLSFLGAFDAAKVGQIRMLAAKIRQEYYHMTPSELTYFFYKFSLGDYGKLYTGRTINPQDILIGLKEFNNNIQNARIQFEEEQKEVLRTKEHEAWKKGCVSLEEWKRMRGIEDKTSNIEMLYSKFGIDEPSSKEQENKQQILLWNKKRKKH